MAKPVLPRKVAHLVARAARALLAVDDPECVRMGNDLLAFAVGKMELRECRFCHTSFTVNGKSNKVYCSNSCRVRACQERKATS